MDLLKSWRRSLHISQVAHYESAKPLSARHFLIGIPTLILSVVVGSTIFAQLGNEEANTIVQIGAGIISLIAGVLAALQTFLSYESRAESHRNIGARCGILRREIDEILASFDENELSQEVVQDIRLKYDNITTDAPKTSKKMFLKGKKSADDKML